MLYNVYKMYPIINGDKVFRGRTRPILVTTFDTGDKLFIPYMLDTYEYTPVPLSPSLYYVVNDKCNDFYTLFYQDGLFYWDGANYKERLIIATELDLTRDQARLWKEID